MKISKIRLKQIIKEEFSRVNEEELSSQSLEEAIETILSSLPSEQQAIIRQYLSLLQGDS